MNHKDKINRTGMDNGAIIGLDFENADQTVTFETKLRYYAMKNISRFIIPGLIFVFACSFTMAGGDTTALEGHVYKVTMSLVKKGKSQPGTQEEITFKGGKFKCKLIGKEMGAENIPIEFTVDSAYTEEGAEEETIYVEFEGEYVNKLDELVKVTGTVDGYGIEGNVVLSKKDFVGSKKEKKK
jgi:hypothetical protein